MAFGARELRLVLSIQSYGTGNIQRLRRDILALNSTTKAMNASQLAVQEHIVRKTQELTRVRDRINKIESSAAARQAALMARADKNATRFGQRRQAVAKKATGLELAAASKLMQMNTSVSRLEAMRGSGMEKFAVRENALATRRLGIEKAKAAFPAKELQLQSRILSNQATQLLRARQLTKAVGSKSVADAIMAGDKNLRGYGSKVKEAAYRWRAAAASGQALGITQKNLSRDMGIYESQLQGVVAQERLIAAGKTEQAAATARQVELTSFQFTQLQAIEAAQAEIASSIAAIDTEEAAVNSELAAQLRTLNLENVQLGRMKVLVGEIVAELSLAGGEMMKNAVLQDATVNRQQALLRAETQARTVAHAGRTAQFAGLIGTAGFALSAGAAANLSKETSLAATQMRDLGASEAQTIQRSTELNKVITDMMTRFPAGAEEMAQSAYEIYSSMNLVHNGVVDVAAGLGLLEVANKAAVAGGVDLGEATTAMITVLNNFDMGLQKVGPTMDTVFSIVRFGNMRLNDFATAMATLAPITASTGISLKSMGGAFATLTILMKNQQRAAAGLSRLFELLRVPAFSKGFENMGVQVKTATGQLRPILDIFRDLIKIRPDLAASQTAAVEFFIQVSKASGMTKAGIQGTVQARRAFEELATHMSLFGNIAKNVAQSKNEMDRALAARLADPGVQWDIMINTMRALIIVIGREALPVFVALGQKIANFVKWFMQMNPHVRTAIVQFGVFISIIGVFGGTLVNTIASVVAMRANLALMTIANKQAAASGVEAAAGFNAMKAALTGVAFAGVGILLAQLIGIKRTIVDLTVVFLVWKSQAIAAAIAVAAANIVAARSVAIAWRSALVATGWGAVAVAAGLAADYIMTHWDQLRAYFHAWREEFRSGMSDLWHEQVIKAKGAAGLIGKWFGKAIGSKTLENWGSGMAASADKALDAQKMGSAFWKAYDKWMTYYRKQRKKHGIQGFDIKGEANRIFKQLQSAEWRKAWDDWANTAGDGASKAANMVKARTNAMQEALKKQNEAVKTAVENLQNIYDQMRNDNQAAFGSLGEGSVMTGVLGSVFTGLNDLLRQFGVQIPIPFAIIRKDFDMQMAYFKRWRTDLAKLVKRGAPHELVAQIQAMGPEKGIPFLEGLLQAPKGVFNGIVKDFKNTQGVLDKATQEDLHRKLKYWRSYGEDAAWQMINGVTNNPRNAANKKKFENYIRTNYAHSLAKIFSTAFSAAMKTAIEDAQAAAKAAGLGAGPGKPPPMDGSGKGGAKLTPIQRAARAKREYESRAKTIWNLMLSNVDPKSAGGVRITKEEQANVDKLMREKNIWRKRMVAANKEVSAIKETANFRGQLTSQRKEHPGAKTLQVTYHGDTYNVKSTISAKQLETLIHRQAWRKRHKVHRGGSSGGGGGGFG